MDSDLWWTGRCECGLCQWEWVGVVPIQTGYDEPYLPMECPNCGNMSGGPTSAPGSKITTGENKAVVQQARMLAAKKWNPVLMDIVAFLAMVGVVVATSVLVTHLVFALVR